MYVRDVGDGSNYIVHVMLFMSEMSKIYKHVFAHNFLNIQQFFNQEKSFEKLRLRAFQPYHQILCKLKHVGDVIDRSSTPKGYNAIYVGDVEDRNNLLYRIYVGDVGDRSSTPKGYNTIYVGDVKDRNNLLYRRLLRSPMSLT